MLIVNLPFLFLGIVAIVGGIIWISTLSHTEENDRKTTDDGKPVDVGLGEYNTESLVMFRGIIAVVMGLILVAIGILL